MTLGGTRPSRHMGMRVRVLAPVLATLAAVAGCGDDDGDVRGASRPDARIEVAVDPRVELLSIVFRLAGNPEYNAAPPSPWVDAVDREFAPVREHEAVGLAQSLRAAHGISFNAPVGLAVYLDPATLQPTRPLDPLPPGLDRRWAGAPLDAFLAAVADFAEAGDFERVYDEHAEYRRETERRLADAIAGEPIVPTFDELFGPQPDTTFRFVPGLLTGPYNYGATAETPGGARTFVQVIGVQFPAAQTLELVVHETAHAYVNPVFDAEAGALADVSEPAFASVEAKMTAQHYVDAPTMVNELVVRAVTILYVRDHVGGARAEALTAEEEGRGFVWIEPLVERIDAFDERPIPANSLVAAVREVLD